MPLQRKVNLTVLVFYGLGSIIGAGIYVLLGEVANIAGKGMGVSFLLAGLIAGLTGLSYAELSSRFPKSAGTVLFVDEAFGQKWLTHFIAVTLLGVSAVSSAVICHGFVCYFQLYVDLPSWVIIVGLGLTIFMVSSADIKQSTGLVALITVLEIGGLVLVSVFASELPQRNDYTEVFTISVGAGPIFAAAFLAFYAFIGFEDMVNVAEEVIEPETVMPRGVMLAVIGSSLLYFMVAAVAILRVDLNQLAQSTSPIATMVGHRPQVMLLLSLISMVAIINGAIVQVIMSARVLYGMAERQLIPSFFGTLHPRTHTPVLNTALACGVTVTFGLMFELVALASVTSGLMLLVFVFVNLSLIQIKRQPDTDKSHAAFRVSCLVPYLAVASALIMLAIQLTGGLE